MQVFSDIAKLYPAMGIQRLLAAQQRLEARSKARCDASGDWLDVAKPPNRCELPEIKECDRVAPEATSPAEDYAKWTMRHPSALRMFDRMMNAAKGKRLVVFLDYDGTLSPIVDDPDQAFMSNAMRSAVREVARYFPTAIISGRCRDKVFKFVQLADVYYAGSHGMDIMSPLQSVSYGDAKFQTRAVDNKGNEAVLFQPAQEFLPMIEEIGKVLQEKTKEIAGVMVENNKFCLSVHYRRVEEEDWNAVEEIVAEVVTKYPRLHITRGRKVIEVRPSIKWDKGHALEYLLETLGYGSANDVLPLYIGDDRTDEDAFKVLKSRGQGYPIIVSSIPRETKASYSLRDPSDVLSFLLRLARWRRNSSSSNLL